MKKTLYFTLLVLVWIVVLFPQDVIWKHLQQNLRKNHVEVKANKVDINLYLLYNKIDLVNLTLFKNIHVDRLKVSYTLLNPTKIKLHGELENKPFDGEINLINKNGFVLSKEKFFKNSLLKRYFKKDTEGSKYEFTY
ncbi:hypothetical protein [Sulfurospirillum arcachonense]|uniref:hypothetical protein n=1 Tax=Sulfurospirillum arcachonense TaxID=57666 RepID=UPI0004691D10|nr:hypothetical protein [Sulfurospirillum arcachonense]